MAIFLRLAALVLIWGFSRWRPAAHADTLLGVDRLSWSRKAQLVWRLVQDNRVPVPIRGVVLLPALYIASPIDLLPDFLPFIGRADDAAVFSLAMDMLVRFTPPPIVAEHLAAVSDKPWPPAAPASSMDQPAPDISAEPIKLLPTAEL